MVHEVTVQAVAVLERLHDHPWLFPDSRSSPNADATCTAAPGHACTDKSINRDIGMSCRRGLGKPIVGLQRPHPEVPLTAPWPNVREPGDTGGPRRAGWVPPGERRVHGWYVMRDPAGLRFCVVPAPPRPGWLDDGNAQRWD